MNKDSCVHTFEIVRKKCRACTGTNKNCPEYSRKDGAETEKRTCDGRGAG